MGFNRSCRMGVALASLAVAGWVGSAQADIVGVAGLELSTAGHAASIISAPSSVLNSTVYNTAQQGFNEVQNYILIRDVDVNGGSIAAGTLVSSHMIFLNKQDTVPTGSLFHEGVEWEFDGDILGVMSDYRGKLEYDSTDILGAAGTSYEADFAARGMEGQDGYVIAGKFLTVDMFVSQPGDWIRVVTAAPVAVPVPAAAWMGLIFMGGLGLFRKLRPTG